MIKYLTVLFFLIVSPAYSATDFRSDANCLMALEMKIDQDPLADTSTSGSDNTAALFAADNPNFVTDSPPGYADGSYLFDAVGDHAQVTTSDGTDLDAGTGLFSLVTWIKSTNGSSVEYITAGTADSYQLSFSNSTTQARFSINTGGGGGFTCRSHIDFRNQGWTHIAGVRELTRTGVLYINGEVADRCSYTGGTSGIDITADFHLGSNGSGGGSLLAGNLTEVAYFSRALTQAEVRSIMNNGLSGQQNLGNIRLKGN